MEIADEVSEKVEDGLKTTRAIAASEAFRKYNWLKNVPVKNASGNFRGMVVSQRWATAFDFVQDALKPIERIALVAALAENIVNANREIEPILASKDPWEMKAARLSTQVSSIAIRTAGGFIPPGVHMLTLALSGYCQIAGLAGWPGAAKAEKRLRFVDAWVSSTFDKVTDGDNISLFINNHLVIH